MVEPDPVLCLGATAAQSLLGPDFRITRERGKVVDLPMSRARVVSRVMSTVHRVRTRLRAPDRESTYRDLVADLRSAASAVSGQNA